MSANRAMGLFWLLEIVVLWIGGQFLVKVTVFVSVLESNGEFNVAFLCILGLVEIHRGEVSAF